MTPDAHHPRHRPRLILILRHSASPAAHRPQKLIITKAARADIDDVLAHLAQTGELDVALRYADRIDDELHKQADVGHGGTNTDWLAPNLRLTVLGRYSTYFTLKATETIIIRFPRGSRDLSGMAFPDDDATA